MNIDRRYNAYKNKVLLDRSLILGYLYVLGHQPVLDQLTDEEQRIARKSVLGSLVGIERHLENKEHTDLRRVLDIIKYRERLNGYLHQHPQLERATAECAEVVYEWLRNEDRWNTLKEEMLGEFDRQVEEILDTHDEKKFLADFDKNFLDSFPT